MPIASDWQEHAANVESECFGEVWHSRLLIRPKIRAGFLSSSALRNFNGLLPTLSIANRRGGDTRFVTTCLDLARLAVSS